MVKEASNGKFLALRKYSAAVTVQLPEELQWKDWRDKLAAKERCPLDTIDDAAMKEVEKLDLDTYAFDFRLFFLPDDKKSTGGSVTGVNRDSCGFTAIAPVGCGKPWRLPLGKIRGTKLKKCRSNYFSDRPKVIAHELGHNLVNICLTFSCIAYVAGVVKICDVHTVTRVATRCRRVQAILTRRTRSRIMTRRQ